MPPLLAKKSIITIVRGFDDWPNILTPGGEIYMWPSAITFELVGDQRNRTATPRNLEVRGRLINPDGNPGGSPDLGADYAMRQEFPGTKAPEWIEDLMSAARKETAEWAT